MLVDAGGSAPVTTILKATQASDADLAGKVLPKPGTTNRVKMAIKWFQSRRCFRVEDAGGGKIRQSAKAKAKTKTAVLVLSSAVLQGLQPLVDLRTCSCCGCRPCARQDGDAAAGAPPVAGVALDPSATRLVRVYAYSASGRN